MEEKKITVSDLLVADNVLSPNACIYVAGHQGMVGSAIVRRLKAAGHTNLITRTRTEVDLTDQQAVTHLFADERIDIALKLSVGVREDQDVRRGGPNRHVVGRGETQIARVGDNLHRREAPADEVSGAVG